MSFKAVAVMLVLTVGAFAQVSTCACQFALHGRFLRSCAPLCAPYTSSTYKTARTSTISVASRHRHAPSMEHMDIPSRLCVDWSASSCLGGDSPQLGALMNI
jgi:hypothetical protein